MTAAPHRSKDSHGTGGPARPEQARSRGSIVAFLTMLALVASLVISPPAAPENGTWLVDREAALPAGAVVLDAIPVADSLVVAASTRPAGAVDVDTPLAWQATEELDLEVEPEPGIEVEADDTGTIADDSPISWLGADRVWDGGEDGARSVVALIDTGVAPIAALDGAVAGEIDFSRSGGGDGYGHGTFLASLIAARDDTVPGVAPGAGVLSLKVAGDDGSTDLRTVLGALQWLHGPGATAGITVAVLALGVDPDEPAAEVLEAATDKLADRGVLLITAAGNDGPDQLNSPATARHTFSVGAADHREDGVVPADFSSTGTDRAGVAQPDVYAPGVQVAGWIAPDSQIADDHAERVEDGRWLRGSGTSMSAALTGGVAALASSARPDLDADALDAALRAGGERLDAAAAVAAAENAPRRPGNAPAHAGQGAANAAGKVPAHAGKAPAAELPGPAWAPASWESVRWRGGAWGSVRWRGNDWTSVRWREDRWESVRWRGDDWRSVRWRDEDWGSVRWREDDWGSVRWRSVRWREEDWSSVRWRDDAWESVRWRGQDWGSVRWRGGDWSSVRWRDTDWGSVRWRDDHWGSVRWR